jgi:hypothetical protein
MMSECTCCEICGFTDFGLVCIRCGNNKNKVSKNKYDCEHTSVVVCPYCGNPQNSSLDTSMEVGEATCSFCDREFEFEVNTVTSYTTRRNRPKRVKCTTLDELKEDDIVTLTFEVGALPPDMTTIEAVLSDALIRRPKKK